MCMWAGVGDLTCPSGKGEKGDFGGGVVERMDGGREGAPGHGMALLGVTGTLL